MEDRQQITGDWRSEFMDKYYLRTPGWHNAWDEWRDLLQRYTELGAVVLEIGGGPDRSTARAVRERAGKIVALDIDPVIATNPFLDESVVYSGKHFPLPNDRFDVVVSQWVNEHIPDPVLHFREIHRVLIPGGVYIFRTVNLFHYKTIVARFTPHWLQVRLVRWLRHLSHEEHDPYPTFYRVNTRRRITALCRKTGFQIGHFRFLETFPAYGMGSRVLFHVFMRYERLVNSCARFEGVRHVIDCIARKSP